MQNKNDSSIREIVRLMLAEDARSLVGDYLWPDNRSSDFKKRVVSKIEPDTPREADLRKRIIGYIMNHKNKPIDQSAAEDLLTIASDPKYSKTLPMYKRGPVYRGISVSETWFKKNFGITYEELLERKPPQERQELDDVVHVFEKERTIKPINVVTSWSKLFVPAADFATGGGASGSDFSVPIVYEANPGGGNFIDLRNVYDLGGDDPYDQGESLWERNNEDEVISIGPVKVSKVHVIGWKFRTKDEPRTKVFRKTGEGYDDVGEDWGRRGLPGRLSVPRKYVDREFDKMNVPDIE